MLSRWGGGGLCGVVYRDGPGRVTLAGQTETAAPPSANTPPQGVIGEGANGRVASSPNPKPGPTATKVPPQVSGGVQHGNAIKRVQPAYPSLAKERRVQGVVEVEVAVSQDGHVVEATPISGPPLLRNAAQQAAQQWVFEPTRLSGLPVQAQRILVFKFTLE